MSHHRVDCWSAQWLASNSTQLRTTPIYSRTLPVAAQQPSNVTWHGFDHADGATPYKSWHFAAVSCWLAEVSLYIHRNRRLIRDGSPGQPPRLSHSSRALLCPVAVACLLCLWQPSGRSRALSRSSVFNVYPWQLVCHRPTPDWFSQSYNQLKKMFWMMQWPKYYPIFYFVQIN